VEFEDVLLMLKQFLKTLLDQRSHDFYTAWGD
jgi:hypothetical protein